MVLPSDKVVPTKIPELHELRVGSLGNEANGWKWRDSPFRYPNSVRSIQTRDEDDVILHHRKRTSRTSRNMSTFSARSSGSTSQTKRRSGTESPLSRKSAKVKREFPLVLLHCSLLPPAMPIKARILDAALLQAVLPEQYWRRWELLTDKITNDLEIQSRGVLIPHPGADYELLEERLLESLELAKPRLRSGHYYGNESVADVEESESDADTAIQGTKCQDCGKKVVQELAQDRKWEVKVYAANGLMRAGAWSAAWNEMEKVDIEVTVCLPEDIKREVQERCLDFGVDPDLEAEEVQGSEPTDAESRRREIYGTTARDPHEKVDGFESSQHYNDRNGEPYAPQYQHQHHASSPTINLKQLFINYLKVLAQDKRNVVIAVLGLAMLFFALSNSTLPKQVTGPNMMPIDVSLPSMETVPRCTVSPVSSKSPSLVVPLACEISTVRDSVTLTESGDGISTATVPVTLIESRDGIQSANPTSIHVRAPSSDETQEVAHEIALES